MRLSFVILAMLAALAACSNHSESPASGPAPNAPPPGQPQAGAASNPNRFMAYSYSLDIETDNEKVAKLYDTAQATCRQAAEDLCVVLESSLHTGDSPSAQLRFRAKASGIRKIMAALGQQGKVTSQSSNAVDLAGPIQDSAKKLELLTDYRARLEALRERAGTEINALITLNKELAEVQSQIEDLSGQRSRLVQQVETELLTVSIQGGPGTGVVIALVAFFALAVWLITWLVRKSRRRASQPVAAQQATASPSPAKAEP